MIAQPTIEALNPRRNNAMEDGSTLPQQGGAELAASSRYVIFRNRSRPGRPSNFPTDPGRALIQAEQCDDGRNGCRRRRSRPISVILARLAQAKDADLLLREALDAAIDIAGADMGNIQLLEPANGRLKIAASRGFSAPFLDFFATVSAHTNSACGATLVNRMRIMVEDVATSYLFVATPALDIML